jgi:hypothetical protein
MVLTLTYKRREFKSILNISVKRFGMGRMRERRKEKKEITRRFDYAIRGSPLPHFRFQ